MSAAADAALWVLAERLYYYLEKFDPSDPPVAWRDLSDWQREYYFTSLKEVLSERDAVLAALG